MASFGGCFSFQKTLFIETEIDFLEKCLLWKFFSRVVVVGFVRM